MDSELAVVDLLSPPFFCWFSRAECPQPVAALCGVGSSWSIIPWRSTTILTVACAAGAALLYYWRLKQSSSSQSNEEDITQTALTATDTDCNVSPSL